MRLPIGYKMFRQTYALSFISGTNPDSDSTAFPDKWRSTDARDNTSMR